MLNQLAGAIKHTPGLFLRASFSTYVVAVEVVDGGLAEHGVVLELTLAEGRSVAGNDDELGLARADGLDGGLVAKGDLSAQAVSDDLVLACRELTYPDFITSARRELIESEVLVFLGAISASVFGNCLVVGKVRRSGPVLAYNRLLEREKSAVEFSKVVQASKREDAKVLDPIRISRRRSSPGPLEPFWLLLACDGIHHMHHPTHVNVGLLLLRCSMLDGEPLNAAVERV